MADLAYTDVTVTIIRKDMARKEKMNKYTLTWAGSCSYPTGGVPIAASAVAAIRRLGMSREVDVEFLEVPQDGFVYKFDRTNMKILMYQSAAVTPSGTVAAPTFSGSALGTHVHDLKVIGGAAGGIDEPIGVEGTDTLAKDAATDRTIVGSASVTKGGVVAITGGTPAGTNSAPAFTGAAAAAAVLVELGNVAVATKTFRIRATGV